MVIVTETLPTLPAETSGTEITRFNALQHGILSRYTVLPWENADEYGALLGALVSVWRQDHHALPNSVVSGRPCGSDPEARFCVAIGRYVECADGNSKFDSAGAAQPGRVQDHQGVL